MKYPLFGEKVEDAKAFRKRGKTKNGNSKLFQEKTFSLLGCCEVKPIFAIDNGKHQ
ncbi:hypothetical protein [Algoriphagus taiwanensis]|uniref:Transposase n=1 Tax=Algoriphagus taiwanensis TaxID=1445656 RepID=A0ABQ6Q0S1_9BACT|nr:hypothetical protein Ataiwa_09040 [Algoriphagus taiwanensis]